MRLVWCLTVILVFSNAGAQARDVSKFRLMVNASNIVLVKCLEAQGDAAHWTARCSRLGGPVTVPQSFILHQYGPRVKRPPTNQLILVPVIRRQDKWVWHHVHLQPIKIPQQELRATAYFLSRWQPISTPVKPNDIDRLVSLTQDTSSFAQAVGTQGLWTHRVRVAKSMTQEQFDRLITPLITPGWSENDRVRIMEILAVLETEYVTKWLANHLLDGLPKFSKMRAALILGRRGGRPALRALLECAQQASGALKHACQRQVTAAAQRAERITP